MDMTAGTGPAFIDFLYERDRPTVEMSQFLQPMFEQDSPVSALSMASA